MHKFLIANAAKKALYRRISYNSINRNGIVSCYSTDSNGQHKQLPPQPSTSSLDILKTLSSHLWPDAMIEKNATNIKVRVVTSVSLLLGAKVINIQVPFIFKDIIDSFHINTTAASSLASSSPSIASIPPEILIASPVALVLGYGIARATSAAFTELRNAVFSTVASGAIRTVALDTFKHLHQLDMQFHLDRNTGELSRIIDRGSRSINFALSQMLFNVVPTALEVGLVSSILAYNLGYEYAVVAATTVGVYTYFTVTVSDWRTQIRKNMNKEEAIASGKIVDSLINYETVKLFNNEEHEARCYDDSLKKFQVASIATQSSLSALNFGQSAIFSVGLTVIMYMTTQNIINGIGSIGDLVLVNGLLFQLSIPLNFIGSVYRELKQATIDMEAMFKLRSVVNKVSDSPTALPYVYKGGDIVLENVRFTYPMTPSAHAKKKQQLMTGNANNHANGATAATIDSNNSSSREILKGLNLHIPAGKTVAIVGSSGSGKSTLFRLLFRFYDPTDGNVIIDGQNVRDVSMKSLRSHIGIVAQDNVLFNETLGYNIRYGDLKANDARVNEVMQLARLDSLIGRLPDGLNTKVGERGLKLSGGEKQRVSIARCFLKDSPLIFLDEATSSLDAETEAAIQESLRTLSGNKTIVIIAHRLSTVQSADLIIVLENGVVVEQGTHKVLIQQQGRYNELVASMMK